MGWKKCQSDSVREISWYDNPNQIFLSIVYYTLISRTRKWRLYDPQESKTYPPNHTASHPRRTASSAPSIWGHQSSQWRLLETLTLEGVRGIISFSSATSTHRRVWWWLNGSVECHRMVQRKRKLWKHGHDDNITSAHYIKSEYQCSTWVC